MPEHGQPPRALWSSIRRRTSMHLVAVVAVVAISIASLTVFLATQQSDLPEETPVPPTRMAATPTEPATFPPVAGATVVPSGSMPDLMRLAPDWIEDDDLGLPVQATYANLERWLAAGDPALTPDALPSLALPEVLATRGLDKAWREVYGFDLRQVDQVLAVGQAPDLVLVMSGRYDPDALYETWVASGYQAVEVEETTVWSLAPGDRIDLTAPASRPSLGQLNHVVLLGDGILVATARQSQMDETLRVVNGDAASLLDRDGLRETVLSPSVVAATSAVIARGELLRVPTGGTQADADALPDSGGGSDDPRQALPEVDLIVFALSGDGSAAMTMLYDDAPEDMAAVREAVEQRARGDPDWSSRYRLEAVTVAGADGDRIEARIAPIGGQGALDLIDQRELVPFSWWEDE